MANKIKVILLEDVEGYGRGGDVVSVSEGYARNALFPQGKAALATEQVQQQHQQQAQKQQKQKQHQLEQLQEIASSYDNTELEFVVKVNDDNELYGSLTAKDIAAKLSEQTSIGLKAKDITIEDGPIKSTGVYRANITLSPEVDFTINIQVTPEAGDDSA